MSNIYGHGEEYRELLAYQLVRQFNCNSPKSYEEVGLILQDMGCPMECENWLGSLKDPNADRPDGTLFWYASPVLVKYRDKTWLITDKFEHNKEDIHYFADVADARITSEAFRTAFPEAHDLVRDWVPF